jgi:hypothetical protein
VYVPLAHALTSSGHSRLCLACTAPPVIRQYAFSDPPHASPHIMHHMSPFSHHFAMQCAFEHIQST